MEEADVCAALQPCSFAWVSSSAWNRRRRGRCRSLQPNATPLRRHPIGSASVEAGFPLEGGEPPPPPPTIRVISVGEEVTGTIQPCCVWGPAVFEMLFDLTAPSDGTLVVHLSNSVSLELEGADYWPWWKSPSALFNVATLQVTAGQTYRLWVYYGGWDLYEQLPFVLTTSIESGPVVEPPGCEFAPPVSNWVCVDGGGWVPPDHPLALGNPPSSPPPPPAPEMPPVVVSVGCPSARPVETWVCVNGGWVPPDHPLALGNSPSSPPPPPAPEMPPVEGSVECPSVRPVGTWVCANGGWVPPDHPLALALVKR